MEARAAYLFKCLRSAKKKLPKKSAKAEKLGGTSSLAAAAAAAAKEFYDVLGVRQGCSLSEVRQAYKLKVPREQFN